MLKSSSRSVAVVAADVGYESEAAFNRAFKRRYRVPPARFRSESRAGEKVSLSANADALRLDRQA
jgi:transcriptional regulator GlxA family with amidase domain